MTGFAEGAGSITYNRGGDQLTLVFGVRLPRSGRRLLEDLRRYFGNAGRIYPTGNDACFFRVTRPQELLRVVEHFDRFPLRGDRDAAFRLWREMVFLRAVHHRSRPPKRLSTLACRLSKKIGKTRKTLEK